MASVQNILKELAASLGYDAVRSACINFAAKKPSDLGVPKTADAPTGKGKKGRGKARAASSGVAEDKPKREQTETQKAWVSFIDEVLAEMKAAAGEGEKVTRKMAMAEAGRRKRESDPEAKAAYEKRQAIKDAKKRSRDGAAASLSEAPAPQSPSLRSVAEAAPAGYTEEEQRAFQFLFDLQASGRTNMMGAPRYLVNELGLDHGAAEDYTSRYMAEYDELAKTFAVK